MRFFTAAALVLYFCGALLAADVIIKEETKDYREYLKNKKSELSKLKDQIATEKKKLNSEKFREKITSKYIQKLEKEIDLTNKELAVFSNNLGVMEESIKELDARIAQAETVIKQKEAVVARILREQYKKRGGEYTQLLLQARSLSEFLKKYKFVKVLSRKNLEDVQAYKSSLEKLREDRETLKLYHDEVKSLKNEKDRQWAKYKNEQWEKVVLLRNIQNNIEKSKKMVAQLEKSAKNLNRLLDKLESTSELQDKNAEQAFRSFKRKFPWPVDEGKVLAKFGKYKHPKFKTIVENRGLHIGARYGSPVYAVFKGIIKYADWFEGYGKMIVIHHGGGYYSVYSHLSRIYVAEGSRVEVKGLIGEVGDTESFYGSEVYFEIRKGSTPLDPLQYLKRQ